MIEWIIEDDDLTQRRLEAPAHPLMVGLGQVSDQPLAQAEKEELSTFEKMFFLSLTLNVVAFAWTIYQSTRT